MNQGNKYIRHWSNAGHESLMYRPSFKFHGLHYGSTDLLNGYKAGIDIGNSFMVEQGFYGTDLGLTLLEG